MGVKTTKACALHPRHNTLFVAAVLCRLLYKNVVNAHLVMRCVDAFTTLLQKVDSVFKTYYNTEVILVVVFPAEVNCNRNVSFVVI